MKPLLIGTLLLLSGAAQAASNPRDDGSAGFARQIYVDNRSTCTARCGTQGNPLRSIGEGVSRLRPGDELIIAGHDDQPYFEWFNLPKLDESPSETRPTLIRGWNGLPKPIIRGTQAYTDWRPAKQPNTYYIHWDLIPPDDPDNILEPEQVYRGDKALAQVAGRVFGGYPARKHPSLTNEEIWPGRLPGKGPEDLQPDQFFYDREDRVLYVRLSTPLQPDPKDKKATEPLEVSIRHFVVVNNVNYKVNNLTLQNLRFERSNTSHYWRGGALLLNGDHITLDQLVVQDMDSYCIQLTGNHNKVLNSLIQRCGQVGLTGGGSDLLVQNNQFLSNNTRGFNPYWEAGAMKFVSSTVLSNSRIVDNLVANTVLGDGIWFDTFQDGNLIANNRIAFNNGIGIHIEVSNKATIDNNVILGNTAQGIQLVDSQGSTITNNVIVGNTQDAVLIHGDSRAQTNPGYRSVRNKIAGNTFAWNWELTSTKNFRSVAIASGNTLLANSYCGSGAGSPLSLRFVIDSTVHDWTSWNKAGAEAQATHRVAPPPAELLERMRKRDVTLVTANGALASYVKAACK
jgi:parallel beta-helix repeat protein